MHTRVAAQRQDEIFDVVDAEDRVIDRKTRAEVHGRQLRHRAVHVLVFNPQGQVFLQKRSMAKDSFPGRWDSSCSGHLDSGEDYAPAAARELGEEIGIRAEPAALQFQLKLPAQAATTWEFVCVYTLEHAGPVQINPAEIERGEWRDAEDVSQAMKERPDDFTPTLRLHWATVAERRRSGGGGRAKD